MAYDEGATTDRREAIRTVFRLPRPATIDIEGTPHHAELIDLSTTGAKFRFTVVPGGTLPQQDRDAVCSIRLESGAVACVKASIRWAMRYPEGVTMGVRFLDNFDAACSCLLDETSPPRAS